MGLTGKKIAKLRNVPGRHIDSKNFYMDVTPECVASWLLRYQRNGRERYMGGGSIDLVPLDQARDWAIKQRQLLKQGIDPIEARKAERVKQTLAAAKSLTFEDAAQQYFDFHQHKWSSAKYRRQFLESLHDYAFPTLGRVPVADIDVGLVLKCLEPIWQRIPETGNRVRGRVESVLDWATVRGYRSGENPARWKNHLSEVLPARRQIKKVQPHRALPFAAMPELMAELARRDGTAALALQFLIFTATRSAETLGACWEEIDLVARLWVIPATRMKGRREFRVPLSDAAIGVLHKAPREQGNPFVFIGFGKHKGLSHMAMHDVLQRMGRVDASVHGMRAVFRTWTAEMTTYPNHVCEAALAHVVSNRAEAAYRRGDLLAKRAHLMADWARYCTTPKHDATITPIRVRQ
jgi:integrase